MKRERKIRGRMFTSSIKHCTRNLHQEVSRRSRVEHRKILKKRDPSVELLFCSLSQLVFDVGVVVVVPLKAP